MIAIGDNLITVARSKRYTAKQFRDLFLYAIGDTDTPPDGLEMVAEMIAADQTSIKDRAEAKAAKNRERVRKAREKAKEESAENKGKAASCNACNAGNACNAPYLPTNLPSNNNTPPPTPASSPSASGGAAAARSTPKWEDVRIAAHNCGVPEDFARQFFADMERDNWAYLNRYGRTATVNKLCLASVLSGRWRARKNGGTADGRGPRGSVAAKPGAFAQQTAHKVGLDEED